MASTRGSTVSSTSFASPGCSATLSQPARRFGASHLADNGRHVDLRHVLAGHAAGVGDLEAHVQAAILDLAAHSPNTRRWCRTGRARTGTAACGPSGRTTCSRPPRLRGSRRRTAGPDSSDRRPAFGRGSCCSDAGKVAGRWPDGFTAPNSTLAIASPPLVPGYQASSTAGTWPATAWRPGRRFQHDHGALVGAGHRAAIRSSWRSGSASDPASRASPTHWVANTTATSAWPPRARRAPDRCRRRYTTFAFGAWAWIARSGDDGWYTTGPGQLVRLQALDRVAADRIHQRRAAARQHAGVAWPPMTAMVRTSFASGSARPRSSAGPCPLPRSRG
jgi:hypothetical protein